MKRKGFITGMMFLLVLLAAFTVRVFYIERIMDKIQVDEQLLNLAMLEENGVAVADFFAGGAYVRAVYVLCLSFFCMILEI